MRYDITTTKLKTLYVMKYFMENTDKENAVTASTVINYLATLGFRAERKSIYSDIDVLNKFGIQILKKGRYGFYYEAG